MNTLFKTSLAISIIGCLNWGLVGLFDFNLVEYLFGDGTILTRIVYVLVMISGLIDIGIFTKNLENTTKFYLYIIPYFTIFSRQ